MPLLSHDAEGLLVATVGRGDVWTNSVCSGIHPSDPSSQHCPQGRAGQPGGRQLRRAWNRGVSGGGDPASSSGAGILNVCPFTELSEVAICLDGNSKHRELEAGEVFWELPGGSRGEGGHT